MSQRTLKDETHHEVCPHGDLILVVGRDIASYDLMRLRVSSHCLRTASSVFDTMFSPKWTEGLHLSIDAPTEMEFPEDDAEAMRVVCCIIHNKNNAVPDPIAPWLALQIGIISDKYDLGTALKYFISKCFEAVPHSSVMIDLAHHLTAAFLLDHDEAFEKTCQRLAIECSDSFSSFFDDELVCQFLPVRLIHALEEGKAKLRLEVIHQLMVDKDDTCRRCDWAEHRSDRYKNILRAAFENSHNLSSIKEILRSMGEEYQEYMDADREQARCPKGKGLHTYTDPERWFQDMLRWASPSGFKLESWRSKNA